jgi:hypothetical protein
LTEDIYPQYYNWGIISLKMDPMNAELAPEYRHLRLALSRIGYFRRGTLLKRLMTCGKPVCACKASPPRLHGPYYQWTRKVDGKTATVNLSAEQATVLEKWIATGRELDRIVAEMEQISMQATEPLLRELPSPTRKPPKRRRRAERPDRG